MFVAYTRFKAFIITLSRNKSKKKEWDSPSRPVENTGLLEWQVDVEIATSLILAMI